MGVVSIGCKKLQLTVTEKKQVQVVLAEDGTLVDDEEYFSFLEPNTALVLLLPNQTWQPPLQPSHSQRDPKTAEMTEVDTGAVGEAEWLGPARRLAENPANIVLLSDNQLQAVLETKLSDLKCVINDNKQAEALQDGCQQLLDDRDRRRETLQLLQLMRDSKQQDEGTPKNEDEMDSCLVPGSIMGTSLEARLCMPQPHIGLSTEELQVHEGVENKLMLLVTAFSSITIYLNVSCCNETFFIDITFTCCSWFVVQECFISR
uniref:CIDE-N domain-containing protein n=1 Tax=Eptatretus burgeri TaxID=7764 RepID=A0A8C4QEC1_EPTBU